MLRFVGMFVALSSLSGLASVVESSGKIGSRDPEPPIDWSAIDQKDASQGIRLLERMQNAASKDPEKLDAAFTSRFAQVCAKADVSHYDALVRIFSRIPVESFSRDWVYRNLADLFIRREVDRLKAKPPIRPSFVQDASPQVEIPKEVPEELASAWREYLSIQVPFATIRDEAIARRSTDKPRGYNAHKSSYWRLVDDLLLGRAKVNPEDFLDYQWDGGCVIGSTFFEPTSVMVFLASIREQRYAEAAGAALYLENWGHSFNSGYLHPERLLAILGLDAERLFAGALAAHDIELSQEPAYRQNHPLFFPQRRELLGNLSAYRSTRCAKFLIEIARLAKPDAQPDYIRTLATLLDRIEGAGAFSPGNERSLDDDTQKEIFRFFDEISGPKASFETAKTVVEVLRSGLRRPEGKPTLLRLLKHPSKKVTESAAKALEAMGETVELPPQQPPVKFDIRINGMPFAGKTLIWSVNKFGPAENVTTGPDGGIDIAREYFLDPTRKIEALFLTTPPGQSPKDPVFLLAIPAPGKLDETHPVEVETKPLELHLTYPPKVTPGADSVSVIFRYSDPQALTLGNPATSFEVPTADRIRLAAIQPGSYRIEIRVPGAAAYRANAVAIDGDVFDVKLEPGADVQLSIVMPDGSNPDTYQRVLLRDGKEINWHDYFDHESRQLRGLPLGEYIFQIPSSAEQKERIARFTGHAPKWADFEGIERRFRIDAESPTVIDLGELVLRPPAQMRQPGSPPGT